VSTPQQEPRPENLRTETDSLNAINVAFEDEGDTTPRPMTPEEIAAIKRFWERQGRKPPPPYDKL
jgi:hypothetical protein